MFLVELTAHSDVISFMTCCTDQTKQDMKPKKILSKDNTKI